ncbi:hypothetical protein ACQVTX_17265 [Bacillus pretiosus]|uniref:hypothetical protein n=1 Tax=Bacillus pretiosus TaxID=2983392 RepID=UPI003D658151
MSNKKPGRKPKEYPESEIKKLLLEFVTHNNIKSEIPKRSLSNYAKLKFREGSLPWLKKEISDNYWVRSERRGFQIIEEYNSLVLDTLMQELSPTINLPDIKNAVLQYHNKPEKLVKILLPYQKELEIGLKQNADLKRKLDASYKKLNTKEGHIKELEKQLRASQDTILKLFVYGSIKKERVLKNLLQVDKEASPEVINALQNVFNHNADCFLNEDKSTGILEMNKVPVKRSLRDNFREL